MIRSGLKWLRDKTSSIDGVVVLYARPGADPIEITAVLGQQAEDLVDAEGGVSVRVRIVDFIVDPAALVIDGNQTLPARGDQIVFEEDGVTRRFNVVPYAGEPEWRDADPYRTRIRIHTQEASS